MDERREDKWDNGIVGHGDERVGEKTHCRMTDASRPNWSTFRATRRSVSRSSSSLLVSSQLARKITTRVMTQNAVRTRSMMLNGDFQNC